MIPGAVISDPDILDGAPVFAGTKVPVQTLVDYWEGGLPVYEFLIDFPAVQRKQAKEFLAWLAEQKKAGKTGTLAVAEWPWPHSNADSS